MPSPDNPKFDPQPVVSAELQAPAPIASDPYAPPSDLDAAVTVAPFPTRPTPIENPVWSGWDVLFFDLHRKHAMARKHHQSNPELVV